MKRTNFTFSFGSMALGSFLMLWCLVLSYNSVQAQCVTNNNVNWTMGIPDGNTYADPSLVPAPVAMSNDAGCGVTYTGPTITTVPAPNGCDIYQATLTYTASEDAPSTDMITGSQVVTIDPSLCTVTFSGDGNLGNFNCANGAPAAPTAMDCAGAVTVTEDAGSPVVTGTLATGQTYVHSYTATAANGCTTTTATATLTYILIDNMDPVANCNAAFTVQLDATGAAAIALGDIDAGATDNCPGVTTAIDVTSVGCTDVGAGGPVTVTLTATDAAGNTHTCTTDVTVEDNVNPTATCKNATVELDASGNATLVPASIDDNSSDACTIAAPGGLGLSQTAFTCADLAASPVTVTLTVTDINGNMATCTGDVTVEDNIDPTITCPADADVNLDASCMIALPDFTGTVGMDNCGTPTTTQAPAAGNVASAHNMTHVITLTTTDGAGNTGTCTVTITGKDVTNPGITCPADSDINMTADCMIAIPDLSGTATTDNCSAAVTVTQDVSGSIAATHNSTYPVVLTATDAGGNTATCTVTYTAKDVTSPTLTCKASHTITLPASGTYSVPNTNAGILAEYLTAADDCDLTLTASMLNVTCAELAASPIMVTVTASDGINPDATCMISVTIMETPPAVMNCPMDINMMATAGCDAVVTWTAPTVGQCSYGTTPSAISHAPGSTFSAGTTTVTYTWTNGNPLEDLTCEFDVIVTEATGQAAPTLDCGALEPMVQANTNAGECYATGLGLDPAMATDDCAGDLTLSWTITFPDGTMATGSDTDAIPSGIPSTQQWPKGDGGANCPGVSSVTYHLEDASGNAGMDCTFMVQISDVENPVAMCKASYEVELDATGNATITFADLNNGSTDNCAVDVAASSISQGAFTCADIALSPISVDVTVMDECANDALCTVPVTVVDKLAPVVTGTATMTTVEGCSTADAPAPATDVAGVEGLGVTIADNCTADADIVVAVAGVVAGTCPITMTRTYTLTDAAGNASEVEHVIKIADTTAPTGTAPAAITGINDCAANAPAFDATHAASTYTDNCGGAVTATMTGSNLAPTSDCAWTMTYTFSVADACGNTLPGQTYTVSGADADAPTGTAPAAITGINDCAANAPAFDATYAAAGYSDDCGAAVTATMTGSSLAPTSDCAWTMTYTFSVADACGNTLPGQTYTVSGADADAPTGTAPAAITGINDCAANAPAFDATYAAAGYSDDCGAAVTATMTGSSLAPTSDCAWTMTYTFSVADACGNLLAGQTYTVSGADQIAPTGTAPVGVNNLNGCVSEATTLSTFDAVAVAAGYSDNCGAAVTIDNMSFSVTGNDCNWRVDYTYDVVDACGNTLSGETYRDQGSDKDAPTGAAPAGATGLNGCLAENTTLSVFDAAAVAAGYTDDCNNVTVTMIDRVVAGDDCAWTVTYTYNVQDDCWNAMLTQSYTDSGSDQDAPTGTAPAGTTGIDACLANALTAAPFDAAAVAAGYADDCSAAVTVNLVSSTPAGDDCAWTVTHVYDVVDACGNTLPAESYEDSGSDQTAPTGTAPAAITGKTDCPEDALANNPFDAAYAASTYSDNCNGVVTAVETSSSIPRNSRGDCFWTITYTFDVIDGCGNILADQIYTISGGDNEAPTGTAPAAITGISACAVDAPAFDAAYAASTYTDNCNDLTIDLAGSRLVGDDCAWTVTYFYSVSDGCGNQITTEYDVSGGDETAPTGTTPAAITGINACSADAPAFDAAYAASTYTDDCNNVTATMTGSSLDPSDDCAWTMTYTFSVADDCGNALADQTYTVSGADAIDPTPVCNAITITLDAGVGTHTLTQAELDAIALGSADNCGAAVTYSVSNDFFDCTSTTTNPNTVTLTVVDACGNEATCDADITVLVGDNEPTAVCQDIDVTLDADGNYTVLAAEVDGGSTGCGNLTLTLTGNLDFDCSHVGPNNTVTLTVSDDSGASDECTAQIDVIASAVCFPAITGGYGNSGGPMIADPCTCRGNGEFDEEIFLRSTNPGQEWLINSVTGLAPWANGQQITDLGDNNYSAVGIHLDGVGYSMEVSSRFFPGLVLSTSNTCFYPDAVINSDLSVICLNTPAITLDGDAGLQSDGTTPVAGTDGFTINGTAANTLDAMALGVGVHTVVYCFDAGTATGNTVTNGVESTTRTEAMDDPGCEECVTQIINIVETPDVLACNDVQISLDENCEAEVNPDMILEGTYLCFDDYTVQITTAAGTVVRNPVGPQFWGQELTATVTHTVSGNSCWGKIIVEDKLGPEFNCSVELKDKMGTVIQSGTVFNITCDVDPADIPTPQSIDNCDNNVDEYLISETITGDECNVLTVTRIYGGEDSHGNAGNTCEITINITQPTVTFPEDISWTCEQYATYANIINPTELNLLINPATASDLDPNWDDTRDNCNDRSESDGNECLANFAGTYVQCVVDPNAHVIEFTQSPTFPNGVAGLEDADVLERTGSGVPSVFEKDACKFTTTWEDQLLTACDGVSTDITFKILRTWTVLNWCTGQVTTDVQVIKVTDEVAPTINTDDLTTEFSADKYSDGAAHAACASSGPLDVPTFEDNCSGVDYASIRVYTPVGEGIAQLDGAGNVIGFSIPAPYLTAGNHTITYEVTDNCGNKSTADVRITIEDGIPPVAICREFTQVALSSLIGGTTAVTADHFNEASYDNCAPVHFLVRKMESGDNCDGFTEHNRFRPEVHFCCDNIGDTVNVILKVYDRDPGASQSVNGLRDNSNECMIRVLVEDKSRPECDAPEDVWTNCDEVADNLDLTDVDALAAKWGTATTRDNCGADAEESAPIVDLDLCGVGTVTRNWVATDAAGNRSLGRCQQVIMIMAQNSYKITIPDDFAAECDVAAPDSLSYEEYGCDLLAVNLEEQDFPASPDGECKKVIRTWRVINWCEYDGASQPVVLPRADLDPITGEIVRTNYDKGDMYTSNGSSMDRSDGNLSLASTGYYEYKQHVKIFDNTAPDVSYNGDTQFCGGDRDEDPCTGPVDLPINASDLCTNTTTTWELSAFSDTFVSADFQGNGTLSGRYPLGTHTVRYYVEDECRNISQLDITFEIIDCKAPTPVCFNGLSVSLMPTGMVSVWASDIDASSFDYCHPIKLAANVVTDNNGDGFVDANDYATTAPSSTEVMLDCNNVGTITFVQLWVGEESSDNVNNWDYCVTTIDVQDNLGACAGSKVALGGKITNEEGESVENVTVELNNGMSAMTSNDGEFSFAVPTGSDVTVTPMKTDDVTNGVSTFDLLLISKHILNVERLDSPYKMIAADANNSNNISTLDLIEIRKVILRVSNEFTNNTSWRFVDKKYAFQDANNPLNENFAEVMSMNNMTTNELNANFTAVKIGDVNGDATPNSVLGVDGRTFNGNMILKASEQNVKAGEEFTVTFTAAQDVQGYQFTLDYDEKAVELVTIENGLTNDNNFNVVNNQIATSWNENVSTKDQEMFSLVFVARADVQVSNIMSVNSAITAAEAYGTNGEMMNISLDFGQGAVATTFELMQNNPNPFDYETTIGFTLPEASSATMTISDVSGKVLRVIEGDYAKGYNEVKLQRTSDLPTGVLIYELETPTNKATRKMTAVK